MEEMIEHDAIKDVMELVEFKNFLEETKVSLNNEMNLKMKLNQLCNAEKMMLYKAYAEKVNKEMQNSYENDKDKEKLQIDYQIDCDVSNHIVSVYMKAWNFLKNAKKREQSYTNRKGDKIYKCKYKFEILAENQKKYLGDTMTSPWTSFKEYLKIVRSDIMEKDGGVPYKYRKGNRNLEKWKNFIIDAIHTAKLVIPDYVQEFLGATYTYGNFIPVPEYFNAGRSNGGKWDYWDLTLLCIYNWYKCNDLRCISLNETDDKYLNKLFSNSKTPYESVCECKEWLNIFKTWGNFIEQNFLQDFVYQIGEGYGQPIMFWGNHSFDNPNPKREEEFEVFYKGVNEKIKKRGERISQKLHTEL